MKGISLDRVLADQCCVPSCGRPPQEDAPFPICMHHMRRVFDYFDGFADLAKQVVAARYPVNPDEVLDRVREANERERARLGPDRSNEQVYYVRIGEFVKIGTTVNVKQRMNALRVDVAELLATEPGGPELERMRHRQFAHLRDGRRENFHPDQELLSHIAMIREHFGPPKVTSWNGRVEPLDVLDAAG